MNGKAARPLLRPSTRHGHIYLARHTSTGIELRNCDTICVVIADDLLPVRDIERSRTLAQLVTLGTPVVWVAEGRVRPLSPADAPNEEGISLAAANSACDSRTGRAVVADRPDLSLALELGRAGPQIRRAICFMLNHYQSSLTLKDLAREACLSPCYFCRLFKNQMGTSCTKYLSLLRVREAARLLIGSDLSVTEICYRVGFNDLTHFERVFKGHVQSTPSGFRRSALTAEHPQRTICPWTP
jgi:AraC-like DNA-binding protein